MVVLPSGQVGFVPVFAKDSRYAPAAIDAANQKFDTDASWRARLFKGANDVKTNLFFSHAWLDKAREAKKLEKAINKSMREKGDCK